MMSLSDMANRSYEKRQQRIMRLRRWFNDKEVVTVDSVIAKTGYAKSTVIKWAKDGDIPLIDNDGNPVVPLNDRNTPTWLAEILE